MLTPHCALRLQGLHVMLLAQRLLAESLQLSSVQGSGGHGKSGYPLQAPATQGWWCLGLKYLGVLLQLGWMADSAGFVDDALQAFKEAQGLVGCALEFAESQFHPSPGGDCLLQPTESCSYPGILVVWINAAGSCHAFTAARCSVNITDGRHPVKPRQI
jgi:hypothetical protein